MSAAAGASACLHLWVSLPFNILYPVRAIGCRCFRVSEAPGCSEAHSHCARRRQSAATARTARPMLRAKIGCEQRLAWLCARSVMDPVLLFGASWPAFSERLTTLDSPMDRVLRCRTPCGSPRASGPPRAGPRRASTTPRPVRGWRRRPRPRSARAGAAAAGRLRCHRPCTSSPASPRTRAAAARMTHSVIRAP